MSRNNKASCKHNKASGMQLLLLRGLMLLFLNFSQKS